MTSLDHMRYLAETIGPRGSTTEEEARAAGYVTDQLASLGFEPQRHVFLSAESAYAPYALFAALFLLCIVLFWQPQPVGAAAAAILGATILVSVIQELLFRSNLLRWLLPVDQSQNVYARIPCADVEDGPSITSHAPQTIVITAHLDTHRTPLIFRSPGWLNVFRLLLPVGIIAAALLVALFVAGIFMPDQFLRQAALVPGLVIVAILVLMLQADRTPFSPGADDNASGVGTALQLAERLKQEPLHRTNVLVVFTGCEEVGCYGADAFMSAHRSELAGARHVVIDQVAGAGTRPCIVRGERFLASAPSDPALLAIADRVAALHPEWGIKTLHLNTAYGELSIGVKRGLRAIAFGALRDDGTSPHWHKSSDVMANVDISSLEHSLELVWEFLRAVDAAAH